MVDIDPVSNEDAAFLQNMIQKHFEYTKSAVANFVLSDFENQLKNFVKVFPKDYKKALQGKKEKAQVSK
jgi:glutamate synthase (NADPH/NADH) large chain